MKNKQNMEIKNITYYNNGTNSQLHVYFADGKEFHRTIQAYEVRKLARLRNIDGDWQSCLAGLLKKYAAPQQQTGRPLLRYDRYGAALLNPAFREYASIVGEDAAKELKVIYKIG